MLLLIILLPLMGGIFWTISTINGFTKKEIKIQEAMSGIEVALTQRYDLLTKLLDVSRGYMDHEAELFANVVSIRRGMNLTELDRAQRQMGELAGQLFAVAENYPQLRSSEVFVELQQGISDSEEHLQAARRLYNANVSAYNTAIAVFPASLLAGNRTPREFFDAEDEKCADVKMRF